MSPSCLATAPDSQLRRESLHYRFDTELPPPSQTSTLHRPAVAVRVNFRSAIKVIQPIFAFQPSRDVSLELARIYFYALP